MELGSLHIDIRRLRIAWNWSDHIPNEKKLTEILVFIWQIAVSDLSYEGFTIIDFLVLFLAKYYIELLEVQKTVNGKN